MQGFLIHSTLPTAGAVRDTVAAYERRYGQPPAFVAVHPDALAGAGGPQIVAGVEVRASAYVARCHFWAVEGEATT